MRTTSFFIAAALTLTIPAAASAQDTATTAAPLAIKTGALVVSSDGKIVGEVERVLPTAVSVIYDSRFVQIPTATLTAANKRLVTSLSLAEIRKLK